MNHELVIIWDTGDKEVFSYKDEATAERAERNMKKALGNQIAWSCVRPGRISGKGVE